MTSIPPVGQDVLIAVLDVSIALGVLASLFYLYRRKSRDKYILPKNKAQANLPRGSWYHLRSFLLLRGKQNTQRGLHRKFRKKCSFNCDHEKGFCPNMYMDGQTAGFGESLSGPSLARVLAYIDALPPDTNDYFTIREVSIRSESEIGSEDISDTETAIDLGWLEVVRDFPQPPDVALLRNEQSLCQNAIVSTIIDEYLPPNPASYPSPSTRPSFSPETSPVYFPSGRMRSSLRYPQINVTSVPTDKSWGSSSAQSSDLKNAPIFQRTFF